MDIIAQIEKDFSLDLSPASKKLIREAAEALVQSNDPLNGFRHSLRLLKYLQTSISHLKLGQNIEVIILAIFWHDIWKATKGAPNFLNSIIGLFLEGRFSSKIFLKAAKNSGLPPGLTKAISRVINEHSSFVFYRSSTESKLFHDIDQIDSEDPERLKAEQKALEGKFLVKALYSMRKYYPKFFYFKEIYQLNRISSK